MSNLKLKRGAYLTDSVLRNGGENFSLRLLGRLGISRAEVEEAVAKANEVTWEVGEWRSGPVSGFVPIRRQTEIAQFWNVRHEDELEEIEGLPEEEKRKARLFILRNRPLADHECRATDRGAIVQFKMEGGRCLRKVLFFGGMFWDWSDAICWPELWAFRDEFIAKNRGYVSLKEELREKCPMGVDTPELVRATIDILSERLRRLENDAEEGAQVGGG